MTISVESCKPGRLDDLEAELAQARVQVARVVEHAGEQLAGLPPSDRSEPRPAPRRPLPAPPEAVNMNGRDETRRNSITSAGPAITPPHEASDLENVAIRRSTWSSTPEQLARAGPASAEHAEGVSLVDHQSRAEAPAELGDLRQRGDVALHREHAVDHDEDLRLRPLRPSPASARGDRGGCGGTL